MTVEAMQSEKLGLEYPAHDLLEILRTRDQPCTSTLYQLQSRYLRPTMNALVTRINFHEYCPTPRVLL